LCAALFSGYKFKSFLSMFSSVCAEGIICPSIL
jgi:hypothetical protein